MPNRTAVGSDDESWQVQEGSHRERRRGELEQGALPPDELSRRRRVASAYVGESPLGAGEIPGGWKDPHGPGGIFSQRAYIAANPTTQQEKGKKGQHVRHSNRAKGSKN